MLTEASEGTVRGQLWRK